MGRDPQDRNTIKQPLDFNSHARVGRDIENILYGREIIISTHTPAWGATNRGELNGI